MGKFYIENKICYPLLQSYDFYKLNQTEQCQLQIGGNDQWSNICDGIELCSKFGSKVFGLTFPLLTNEQGQKFGKSGENNIWLSPCKTSIWNFYNFWINLSDSLIQKIFLMFSLKFVLPHMQHTRLLQEMLAFEMTELVHGLENATICQTISSKISQKTLDNLNQNILENIGKVCGQVKFHDDLATLLVSSGFADSKSSARKLIDQKSVKLDWYGDLGLIIKGKKDLRMVYK